MARLEFITYTPHRCTAHNGLLAWAKVKNCTPVKALPQIYWNNSRPWREPNLWAMLRASTNEVNIKTVQSNLISILTYANWLEITKANWWDFPLRKSDRCLTRYRGWLIEARSNGMLAPSTVSQRMRDVILFYRWMHSHNLISPSVTPWIETTRGIKTSNSVGLERTINIQTTDLAIRNNKSIGDCLEDGLLPVSAADRERILIFTKAHGSTELYYMLLLGFFTGMRIGTIADLKVLSLERAIEDPAAKGLFRIAVGPGASPPVHTKYGVTGHIWIAKEILDELIRYAYSARRLVRQSKASKENGGNLFLTKFGNSYCDRNSNRSPAINVEMHHIRRIARELKIQALGNFSFHQSRCTFGTELARELIPITGPINCLEIVKQALLHKDEKTTLKYIKFVQQTPAKEHMANTFTKLFLGIQNLSNQPPNA